MTIVEFSPEHLDLLHIQRAQAYVDLSKTYAMNLDRGLAWTAMEGDTVIAIAGFLRAWPGRLLAWALIAEEAKHHMVSLTRAVRRGLDAMEDRRIEAVADSDFDAGHRWLEMLGFRMEGRLRLYTPDGRDVDLFARVRHG